MKKYFNSQDARQLLSVYDFAIFPVHGVKEDGTCTCGAANCERVGKHPASPNGLKDATTDIEEVKKLWQGRQYLNVGIATGKDSGISVIDVDNEKALEKLKEVLGGNIPDTLTVKTGRGYHFYFAYEEGLKSKNDLMPGIDIKSDGGYVIGAKSNHKNGNVYEFENPLEGLAKFPREIKVLMDASGKPHTPLLTKPRSQLLNDGWSNDQTREHLSYINPDCDYDTWIKIGMALHEEGKPFHLWDEWSAKGAKYDNSTTFHWNSFNKGGGVTYGTVVALAKEGGWQPRKIAQNRAKSHVIKNIEQFDPETGEIIEAHKEESGQDGKNRNSLFYYSASSVEPSFDANDFVQDVLTENGLSVIYGESNCGKTFFASDLAFHIAESQSWRGKRVEGGAVLYLSMEGARGLNNRIYAYKKHTGKDLKNLYVMPCTVDFVNPEGNIQEFVNVLQQLKSELGDIDLKMIIVDTLARAIGGGDENSGQDMGMIVKHADAIRAYTSAHVSFVHHSGKDKAKGSRGHSSLRAAVDTEIEVSREEGDDFSNVRFAKQRDLEKKEDVQFTLERVTLGVNKYNEEVTSCIVKPIEAIQFKKPERLSAMESLVFDALVSAVDSSGVIQVPATGMMELKCVTYEEFYYALEAKGYKELQSKDNEITVKNIKSSTNSVRARLRGKNKIGFNNKLLWLIT